MKDSSSAPRYVEVASKFPAEDCRPMAPPSMPCWGVIAAAGAPLPIVASEFPRESPPRPVGSKLSMEPG